MGASLKSFPCISATLHNNDDDGSGDVNVDDDNKANSFNGTIKLVVERSHIRSDANLFVFQI